MAAALYDRVKMTTATTGTGTITLGSAVTGFRSFATASVVNASVVDYAIEDGTNWEIGTGTYTSSGTTLTRSVSSSSNANAAISLTGNAVVYITAVTRTFSDYLALTGGTLSGTTSAATAAAGTDTTQLATTAYVMDAIRKVAGLNAQTGTTYTFVLADAGKLVTGSNASAQTYTVPLNSTTAFLVNSVINIAQVGAGQISIAAAGGVTIHSSGSKLKITGQYSTATLVKIATDEWILFGDIAT